jgi:hypothetical protein
VFVLGKVTDFKYKVEGVEGNTKLKQFKQLKGLRGIQV